MSVPTVNRAIPAATAVAEPELEPNELKLGSKDFEQDQPELHRREHTVIAIPSFFLITHHY